MNALTEKTQKKEPPLHIKYRPTSLDEIIGQDSVVRSLESLIKAKTRPHAYFFFGQFGVGKTSLARILAKEFGCADSGLIELDSGTAGNVDNLRNLLEMMQYAPLQGAAKFLVLDECHALRKESWSALLKSVEEASDHAYYVFCTTEIVKIPPTLESRCHKYVLRPVPKQLLTEYAGIIAENEGFNLPKGSLDIVAREAQGSVRKLLVNLSQIRAAQTLDEVRELLVSATDDEFAPTNQLARLLCDSEKSWSKYAPILKKIEEKGEVSGSVRVLKAHMARVASTTNDWRKFAVILDAINEMPAFPDSVADLQLMVFKVLLSLGQ